MKPTLRSIQLSTVLALAGVACTGSARVGTSATFTASSPDLVYVSPGVYVIADYSEPVFYSTNYYWRYDGGVWYRSRSYTGGWQVSYEVPISVRRIERPSSYVYVRSRVARGGYRTAPPPERSRVDYQPSERSRVEHPVQRGNPAPVVRDHRDASPPPRAESKPHPRDHRHRVD